MPAAGDMNVFALIATALASPERFGFVLPESVLLAKARTILDALPESRSKEGAPRTIYLTRPPDQPSVLETVALRNRALGHSFWEPFLGWVVKQFTPLQLLDDQRILPVGRADLACPRERVFLRPIPRARGSASAGGEAAEAEIELEEPVGERTTDDGGDGSFSNRLPPEVARDLPFLDETVVRARLADSAILTDVGRVLAPERGEKLVRRPQAAEVINDLFGPRLRSWSRSNAITPIEDAATQNNV